MNKGISLIEVIIGAAIISSTFVITLSVYGSLTRLSYQTLPRIQSAMLTDEGVQALRSMRDTDYSSISGLSLNTPYYLVWSDASSSFYATTTPVLIDSMFSRTFTLSNISGEEGRLATINVSFSYAESSSTETLQTTLLNLYE